MHVRWFTAEDRFPVQLDQIGAPHVLVPVAIAAAVTAGATLLWRATGKRSPIPGPLDLGMTWANYETLIAWMPLVIGVHMGVSLLVAGIQRWLFVPNMPLPWHIGGGLLALLEIVVALGFIFGALARPLAAVLGVVWVAGLLFFGLLEPLEQTIVLGVAFFLFAAGRGPLAFDALMERLHRPIDRLLPHAVPVLRIATGIGIAVAAFTEKLLNIPMGLAFLRDYPMNPFPPLGIESVDDRMFVLIAGTVELTFGLLLISGAYVRLTILVLWLPFNLTLPYLGWRELVGHLPIYGVIALMLVWGERRPEGDAALSEEMDPGRHVPPARQKIA